MNCEETLARIRNLTKARVAKHYEANKEKINQKRREAYAKKHPKELKEVVTEPPQITVEKLDTITVPKRKRLIIKKNSMTVENLGTITTPTVAEDFFKVLKETNKTSYINDIKRITKIIKTDDLLSLRNHKKMIPILNTSIQANGKPYSINSIKQNYQCILYLIDHVGLDVPKEPYAEQFSLYKIRSSDYRDVKADEEVVPFKEYLKKIADTLGKDSKMYLIASLYDAFTIRDNYQLKLVKEPDNDVDNFLVVGPHSLEIVIQKYKTDNKYGPKTFKPKKPLEKLIRSYIGTNKLKLGDYLLGDKKLTSYISKANKQLEFSGSINSLRHMKATDKKDESPEERLKQSNIMGHSSAVHKQYVKKRKLKVI